MNKINFVLVFVLSFSFVTVCLAMGKLNTQDAKTTQEFVQDSETAVVSEAYSDPVDIEEVEDLMKVDVEPVQEIAVEPEIVEDLGILEELGIIDQFKALTTTGEKTSFLLAKANELYNSEQFQKAVDAAQYVLQYLDPDSQEAKDLLAMAKDALVAATSDKLEEAKTGIGEKLEILGQ
ncbi:MAG: hypothetical protein ABIA97_03585 [Candidatus Omnitrophota bacterium]